MALDGNACIRLLSDRAAPVRDRAAAAESLVHFPRPEALDALWDVVSDPSEQGDLLEEAAGALGSLWCEMGVDYRRLVEIPDRLLAEVVADFDLNHVVLDRTRLGRHEARFARLFGAREFMSGPSSESV